MTLYAVSTLLLFLILFIALHVHGRRSEERTRQETATALHRGEPLDAGWHGNVYPQSSGYSLICVWRDAERDDPIHITLHWFDTDGTYQGQDNG